MIDQQNVYDQIVNRDPTEMDELADVVIHAGIGDTMEFCRRLVSDAKVAWAMTNPPEDTRAYFRGRCASKFAKFLYGASWTSVLFDAAGATVKKVPLMDPHRGTKSLTEALLNSVDTVDALLDRLKA